MFLDAIEEQDEETGNPGKLMDVLLHTLSNSLKKKTITLRGLIGDREVCILVDTGGDRQLYSSQSDTRVED